MRIDTFVDYSNHPAFSRYNSASASSTSAAIRELFGTIDSAIEVLLKTECILDGRFIVAYFESHIDRHFSEIAKMATAHLSAGNWFIDIIPVVIEETRKCLFEQVLYEQGKKTSIFQVCMSAQARNVSDELRNQGVSMQKVPEEYLTHIYENVANYRAELQKQAAENPNKLLNLPLPMQGAYWQIAFEILKATGITDGISLFAGYQMQPIYCVLALAHDKQTWYDGCYNDVGLSTSKLAYMHYDHDYDVVKAILYLNRVTEENGPFQVVPESAKWIPSMTQGIYFKFQDQNNNKKVERLALHKSDYYRPFFKQADLRSHFMELPCSLRGTSHFGDDLLDDSPLTKILASKELSLTSDLSNCFCFMGSETMHRGGISKRGDRWVFQVAFRKSAGPN